MVPGVPGRLRIRRNERRHRDLGLQRLIVGATCGRTRDHILNELTDGSRRAARLQLCGPVCQARSVRRTVEQVLINLRDESLDRGNVAGAVGRQKCVRLLRFKLHRERRSQPGDVQRVALELALPVLRTRRITGPIEIADIFSFDLRQIRTKCRHLSLLRCYQLLLLLLVATTARADRTPRILKVLHLSRVQ